MRIQPPSYLAAASLLLSFRAASAATCLMVYISTDNAEMESYARQKYTDLTSSALVSSPAVRTWIYYDAFHQGNTSGLPNTIDSTGTPMTEELPLSAGSYLFTYDPDFGSMRMDNALFEKDSDSESDTQHFLSHALEDCLADGFNSTMVVFAGLGGDANDANGGLASAIRAAIGGPLDVVGFDASSMQAWSVADDYQDVAKYLLASEGLVPGHGFPYKDLQPAATALELSKQILPAYPNQDQTDHRSDAMSLVDLSKFGMFVSAWEDRFEGLARPYSSWVDEDLTLHAFLSRARASATTYMSNLDSAGSRNPSSADIGSWLHKFNMLCNPGEPLMKNISSAFAAYHDIFVDASGALGTVPGTGMHVLWPDQGEYYANPSLWKQILFDNAVSETAPNFKAFLQAFLKFNPASSNSTSIQSVCNNTALPEYDHDDPALILDDSTAVFNAIGQPPLTLQATIFADVSYVSAVYGIDLSSEPLRQVLTNTGYEYLEDEHYLLQFGGSPATDYEGSNVFASWDKSFHVLHHKNSTSFTLDNLLYVDGAKRAPCMYFPETESEIVAGLQPSDFFFFDPDVWNGKGAHYCLLRLSEDNPNPTLFVSNAAGVWVEQPSEAGGYLIPLVYVDGYFAGQSIDVLAGGLNQTVLAWEPDYKVISILAEDLVESNNEIDSVFAGWYADDPSKPTEARLTDIIGWEMVQVGAAVAYSPTASPTTFPVTLPPSTIDGCYTSLDDVFLLISDDDKLFQQKRFVICPGNVIEVGFLVPGLGIDQGEAPIVPRSNTEFLCGEDGKSENNCIIKGGDFGVFAVPVFFRQDISVKNVQIKGFTFEDQDQYTVMVATAGDIAFIDCIFRNTANFGPLVFNYDSSRHLGRQLEKAGEFDNPWDAALDYVEQYREEKRTQGSLEGINRRLESTVMNATIKECLFSNLQPVERKLGVEFGIVSVNTPDHILTIADCRFENNSYGDEDLTPYGYGVRVQGAEVTLNGNCFLDNDFRGIGAVLLETTSNPFAPKFNRINGNYATEDEDLDCQFAAWFATEEDRRNWNYTCVEVQTYQCGGKAFEEENVPPGTVAVDKTGGNSKDDGPQGEGSLTATTDSESTATESNLAFLLLFQTLFAFGSILV